MSDATFEQRLQKMRAEFDQMTSELQAQPELPREADFLPTVIACHAVRTALIAFDIALYARHKQRHPRAAIVPDLSPTQPLDAATRAEIDATP